MNNDRVDFKFPHVNGAPNKTLPKLKELKIGSLNVCGLVRRMHYPEFREMINGFDIFGVAETKLDDLDVMSLTNYTYIGQTRKQKYKRKSGGLGVFVKSCLVQVVTVLDSPSDYVLWLKLSKTAFHIDHDVVLGIIYQPPETSKFFNNDEAELLEIEISAMCIDYNYVYLMGDMNARTSDIDDFTEVDDFMADYFEFDESLLNYFNEVSMLKVYDIPLKRVSLDKSVNKHGEKLLDTCKGNNLFILNGRVGKDKNRGKLTFRDTSILDYAIANADGLKFVHDFEILDKDALFSDGHSLLSLTLKLYTAQHKSCSKGLNDSGTYKHWENDKIDSFVSNVDPFKVQEVTEKIRQMKNSEIPIDNSTINDTVEKLSHIFEASALKSFRQKQSFSRKSDTDKIWFGQDCHAAKNAYENAKSKHRKNPTPVNKTQVQDKRHSTKTL